MNIKQIHISLFNTGKHPSANEAVNAQTGYTREVYLKLRDIRQTVCGHVGKISMKDVRRYI